MKSWASLKWRGTCVDALCGLIGTCQNIPQPAGWKAVLVGPVPPMHATHGPGAALHIVFLSDRAQNGPFEPEPAHRSAGVMTLLMGKPAVPL